MGNTRGRLFNCFLLFLSLGPPGSYGQSVTGLLKENLTSRYNVVENKWENSFLGKYGYDNRGNQVVSTQYIWNLSESGWQLSDERKYQYNENDEKVLENYNSYYSKTGEIRWEMESTYEEGRQILEKGSGYDSTGRLSNSSIVSWQYNNQGQILEWKSEFANYNEKRSGISVESSAYDKNGCLTGSKNEYQGIDQGAPYYGWDSVGVVNDSKCRFLHRNIYYKESRESDPVFLRSITRDIDYDTAGFPVKETIYHNCSTVPVNEGTIVEVVTYTNNENGMPVNTFILHDYGGPDQIIQEYDSKGRETFREVQQYDSAAGQWQTYLRLINNYNEFNDLIFSSDEESYNPTTGRFDVAGDAEWIYNEKHFLEKVTGHWWGFNWQINSYEDVTWVIEFTDRCDGNVSYSEMREQEGNGMEGTVEKSEYVYYDISNCETIDGEEQVITLFPNPAESYINILSDYPIENPEIRIMTSGGQVLLTKKLMQSNYISMDLEGLSPGVYFLKVISEKDNYTSRFIISE